MHSHVTRSQAAHRSGFTLIELLVVMAILATLLSIAAPRYFQAMDRAKETALRTNLRVVRDAIDKFNADTGTLPKSLQALVDGRYVRSIPIDPITDDATSWVLVPHPDNVTQGVYDLRSGAPGAALDGTAYGSW